MAKIQEYLSLSRPIRYVTKDDLMFQGMAPSGGRDAQRRVRAGISTVWPNWKEQPTRPTMLRHE
jgi:hypothetical protein